MQDTQIIEPPSATNRNAEPAHASSPERAKTLRGLASALTDRIAKTLGDRYLPKVVMRRAGVERELRAIPERIQRVAKQSSLVLELLDDYRSGRYREITLRSLALAAGALLYTVSPGDVVPDFLPLLGSLDDAFVLALAMRLIRRDLERYCRFKGYSPAEYFDSRI